MIDGPTILLLFSQQDAIVYNTMISLCAKAKDWVETEKLWRKLRKNSIKGTSLTYDLFINTFVQCNCAELAIQACHESIQFGFGSSEATRYKPVLLHAPRKDIGNWQLLC
jgi:pentatricopeptide repeat protein